MNVVITINGKDHVVSANEAQKICRSIYDQLHIPVKDKDENSISGRS